MKKEITLDKGNIEDMLKKSFGIKEITDFHLSGGVINREEIKVIYFDDMKKEITISSYEIIRLLEKYLGIKDISYFYFMGIFNPEKIKAVYYEDWLTMVQMNVNIGDTLNNVKCCNKHPTITEYFENKDSFRIGYKCELCKAVGGFGMIIPKKKKTNEEWLEWKMKNL